MVFSNSVLHWITDINDGAVLAEDMKNRFTEQVKSDLEKDFSGVVTLRYERLFAYGEKA